jgi:hypothetical protein
MSTVSTYDELNILPKKQRSEPYEQYFSKMSISDKEKEERIAFSEHMEEVILYVFALIETTIENGETSWEYIQTQLYDKYLDIVLLYMPIDKYIRQYAKEISKEIVETTFQNIDIKGETIQAENIKSVDSYYLSNDRAMFIAECEANSMLNYKQYSAAVQIGKTKKTWVDIRDSHERKSHLEVGGTTIPIDEPFSVGGSLLMFPKDYSLGASADQIVNCRCSVKYS